MNATRTNLKREIAGPKSDDHILNGEPPLVVLETRQLDKMPRYDDLSQFAESQHHKMMIVSDEVSCRGGPDRLKVLQLAYRVLHTHLGIVDQLPE